MLQKITKIFLSCFHCNTWKPIIFKVLNSRFFGEVKNTNYCLLNGGRTEVAKLHMKLMLTPCNCFYCTGHFNFCYLSTLQINYKTLETKPALKFNLFAHSINATVLPNDVPLCFALFTDNPGIRWVKRRDGQVCFRGNYNTSWVSCRLQAAKWHYLVFVMGTHLLKYQKRGCQILAYSDFKNQVKPSWKRHRKFLHVFKIL